MELFTILNVIAYNRQQPVYSLVVILSYFILLAFWQMVVILAPNVLQIHK